MSVGLDNLCALSLFSQKCAFRQIYNAGYNAVRRERSHGAASGFSTHGGPDGVIAAGTPRLRCGGRFLNCATHIASVAAALRLLRPGLGRPLPRPPHKPPAPHRTVTRRTP